MLAGLEQKLAPIMSRRFIKFGIVGASGVVVNLGFLFLFKDVLHLHQNLSSAAAIELSIISNFLLNDRWTFKDRRERKRTALRRAFDFHIVSALGAFVQLVVFVGGNAVWAVALADGQITTALIENAIFTPPDVGALMYVSQLAGIGAAMFWNFLGNFYWTWKSDAPRDTSGE